MMRPDTKVEKVYLYPKPVDFRKSIDGLTALVELDIKVAVFDPMLFVFLNICLAVLLVTPIMPLVQINLRSK